MTASEKTIASILKDLNKYDYGTRIFLQTQIEKKIKKEKITNIDDIYNIYKEFSDIINNMFFNKLEKENSEEISNK